MKTVMFKGAIYTRSGGKVTQLVYLPVNKAYAFLFGPSLVKLKGEDLMYPTKAAASQAAENHGMIIDSNGRCRKNPSVAPASSHIEEMQQAA